FPAAGTEAPATGGGPVFPLPAADQPDRHRMQVIAGQCSRGLVLRSGSSSQKATVRRILMVPSSCRPPWETPYATGDHICSSAPQIDDDKVPPCTLRSTR